jgi:hypothetical protein
MKSFSLYHFAILAICVCCSKQLAGYYYDRGDFAKMGYEELLVNIPQNMQYF